MPSPPPALGPSTAPQRTSFDVAIIGGGPGGAAAAIALADRGRRVAVFERELFPRFHIGESLLPASNPIFERLGIARQVASAGFVEKLGASFVTEDGALECAIDFTACRSLRSPQTYQVPRARFDALLLDRARQVGAEVFTGHRVAEIELGNAGVRLSVADRSSQGSRSAVEAATVIDASGQAGFLAKRLGLRQIDPELRNVAVYAHYRGIPRPAGPQRGNIRVVSRFDLGWVWLIPLPDGVTSVGVVRSREAHRASRSQDPADQLEELLAATPVLAGTLAQAERIGPAHVAADFSYAPSAYAGDRWLLAGDAGSFLDPVFSTGVLLALESGIEAADEVDRALARDDLSAPSFRRYDRRQRRRYRHFRRFVRQFYDPCFRDLFFQPTSRFGILDAVVGALAGDWRPGLRHRLALSIFFGLAALQRRVTLVPRSHSGLLAPWRSKGEPPCPTPSPSAT